jgi:hypothetical protein
MPPPKYSCWGPAVIFWKGSTAMDVLSGGAKDLADLEALSEE